MRLPFKFSEKTFSAFSLAVIGAAVILIIAGVLYFVQQERQRQSIEEQTSRTNQLIEDLKKTNEQNRNYAYCNAVLLAKYTQDQQPIFIEDLDKCVFTSFPKNEGPADEVQSNAQTFLAPQSSTPAQTGSSTVQPRQTFNPQQTAPASPVVPTTPITPTNPQTPAPTLTVPNLLEVKTPCIDALGLIKTC